MKNKIGSEAFWGICDERGNIIMDDLGRAQIYETCRDARGAVRSSRESNDETHHIEKVEISSFSD